MTSQIHPAAIRARCFYDEWSTVFLEKAGPVFQSGLLYPPSPSPRTPEAATLQLAHRAGLQPGMRVLDAGCGVGGPATTIATALGVEIDGVTISELQVELGRDLARQRGCDDSVRLHVADFHQLPFDDATFDVVLVMEATGYSHDVVSLVLELSRVLRPGGTLYVKDVFRRSDSVRPAQLAELHAYEEVWGCETTWTMPDLEGAMQGVGMTARSAVLDDVSIDHFIGSMVDLDPAAGLVRNEMGRHFFQTYENLPVCWGEVVGTYSDSPGCVTG